MYIVHEVNAFRSSQSTVVKNKLKILKLYEYICKVQLFLKIN